MERLLHDAKNLGILPAFDPDDAPRVEAEAGEARRIAVRAAHSPQRIATAQTQNPGCQRCRKGCRRWRKFGLKAIRADFVKRTKLKTAMRKSSVQPVIFERQEPIA